jgi:hypothetical protein
MACWVAGVTLREIVNLAGPLISGGTASRICGSPPVLMMKDRLSLKGVSLVPPTVKPGVADEA